MEWSELIIALAGPVFMAIGGIISWIIKNRSEELRTNREKLKTEQRKIYSEILEPYIRMFADIKGEGIAQAVKKIKSYDYRKTAFELSLIGSDEVVDAYIKLMQHSYQAEETGKQDPSTMMNLWGSLLLEIRKSLGHNNTKLIPKDMLRPMISDIDKYL